MADLGPWPLGMDNISAAESLPADRRGNAIAVADAVNVNIERDGVIASRPVATRLSSERMHSLRGDLIMAGSALNRVAADGALTAVGQMPSDAPAEYVELNGETYVASVNGLRVVRGGTLQAACPPTLSSPATEVLDAGGLHGGLYAVAISQVVNGVEGGLSRIATASVPEGGGMLLGLPPTDGQIRIYRTTHNGKALHHAMSLPAGTTSAALGAGQLGHPASTRNLEPLPGGRCLCYWRGRLLMARGNQILASQSMRYGLYDPRYDWRQLPGFVRFIAPVESGFFVGLPDGVVFMRGAAFDELEAVRTACRPPISGATTLPPDLLGFEERPASDCAVWLSSNGFVIGLPGGQVVEPQAKRIQLSGSSGEVAVIGRRVVAIIN